jgi:hypothetical protein
MNYLNKKRIWVEPFFLECPLWLEVCPLSLSRIFSTVGTNFFKKWRHQLETNHIYYPNCTPNQKPHLSPLFTIIWFTGAWFWYCAFTFFKNRLHAIPTLIFPPVRVLTIFSQLLVKKSNFFFSSFSKLFNYYTMAGGTELEKCLSTSRHLFACRLFLCFPFLII